MKKQTFTVIFILASFFSANLYTTGQKEAEPEQNLFETSLLKEFILPTAHPLLKVIKERKNDRRNMIIQQIYNEGIRDKSVLTALLNVPRHIFVPVPLQAEAYADTPLPIGYAQTISQPYIVAYMTQHLDLKPGEKVLEIGTGSGYQAAILSEFTDNIYTIEIIEPLYARTAEIYKFYRYTSIKMKYGDGYYGWEEYAPFDKIIVTAAAGHVPPPLVAQLNPGGKIIIPVGGIYNVQTLIEVNKAQDGSITTKQLLPVRFVPMKGAVLEKG